MPFFPIAALVWLSALPLIRLLAAPEGMAGLLAGWAAAGISGVSSFGLLALSNRKPIAVALKAVMGGFTARMLLVIVGVVAAVRLGYGPGWFCLSFFTLYWIFFGLETLSLLQGMKQGRRFDEVIS